MSTPNISRLSTRVAFPLSLKVSTWLILNILLLTLIGAVFFFAQIGFRWESLISGPASDRVQAISNIVVTEMNRTPGRDRDEILAPYDEAYRASFMIYRLDGAQEAGQATILPDSVKSRFLSAVNPGGGPGGPGGPGGGRGGPQNQNGQQPQGGRGGANGSAFAVVRSGPQPQPINNRFMVRTTDPTRYWIGIRILIPNEDGSRRMPAELIAVTDSFGGAGLIIDFKPWLVTTAVVGGLSILFWLPLVRGITHTLRRITHATEQIAEGRFETRVTVNRRDELGRLGDTVNQMAGRLDSLVNGQKRFLGDIAHELGSPIARMQFATSILEDRADPSLKGAVSDVREEVQHMSDLVNELLAFTRAGLRPREAVLVDVDIMPLVGRVLDREDAASRVKVSGDPGLKARADSDLLARAIGNLVRNAVRYAGNDGPISVHAERTGELVRITIEDSGPGVPPDALARLGEPFFRPETARSRETGGVGLGLAIVKSAVEACRGTIRFSNRKPHGFKAEIEVAAASPTAAPGS